MADRSGLMGKRVVVMGLGRFGGGVGAARFLAESGARVVVTDLAPADKLAGSISQLDGLKVEFHLGGHVETDFTQSDLIVINPAVPDDSPWLKLARGRGVPITTEMNLFFERCPALIVGITGSNGKSTTTAMIHAVLKTQYKTWLGGNIGGDSLLARIREIESEDRVVLELSSFQLERLDALRRSPHVAVVTNITPNHLDRHGTMANYTAAKQAILRYQTAADHALFCALEPPLADWAPLSAARITWFPADEAELAGIELAVPGRHNQINASAALAVGRLLGIDETLARAALKAFPGLPHRIEFVREVAGVRYYNDSIATTPESVMVAIDAFDQSKTIILGGYDKKISFEPLAQKLVGAVDQVVLLGQVRPQLHQAIEAACSQSTASCPVCHLADTFEQAVACARDITPAGGVVLMSPACASYDMFTNFQQRGETFRKLVNGF